MPEAANPPAPPSPSKSIFSALGKWVAGIATAVITALLVYHFTPQPSQSIDFYGIVIDAASNAFIPNATVEVTLNQNSVSQQTDTQGRYNFALANPASGSAMYQVTTSAQGYRSYTNSIALQPGSNSLVEIPLQSDAAAAAPPPSGGQPQPGTGAPTAVRPHPVFTIRPALPLDARRQTQAQMHAKTGFFK
jgi:hypothetical protein